ncbi:MAG: hypothetical protein UDD07_04705 [Lachnospiraceae bacterium]|nr:hypothetical protein [Lachnospiraceae bacterium]
MEFIKANGAEYACKAVVTGVDSITFSMEGQAVADMEEAFRPVAELTVAGEDKEIYGTYKNLYFESATAYGDGTVMVTMHIKSETELRFESLEQTQAEQDEVLAELLGGEV